MISTPFNDIYFRKLASKPEGFATEISTWEERGRTVDGLRGVNNSSQVSQPIEVSRVDCRRSLIGDQAEESSTYKDNITDRTCSLPGYSFYYFL